MVKNKPFPVAICVMSDRGDVCIGHKCSVNVKKCFPNYKIPKEKK
jgi:hypothetical protein